ncbi:MAG TPA: TolC family protein [Opitutaceae bacterium]
MIRPLRLAASLVLFAPLAFSQPAPSLAKVDPQSSATPALTLEECVARALGKNFDLKIQEFDTQNARDAITIAQAAYDPTLQASASTGKAKSAEQNTTTIIDENGNPVVVVLPSSRSEGADIRLGVSQKIVTGATVSASGALDRSKRTPASSRLNPAYDSDVTLSINQPLLQGSGLAVNRAAIARARIGLTRSEFDFKSAVLSVVRNVEAAYYDLGFAREQLAVRRFSLQVAEQLFEENEAKRNTGVATDLDVLQAEVGVANARRNVLLAEQTVRDSEDNLLQLIGQFEFNTTLGDVKFTEQAIPAVSFDESYQRALTNAPDYASAKAAVEQLKLDARVAKNNTLPALDLGGAVGLNNRDDSWGDAAQEAFSRDGYSWQVDLTLTVPWGLRAEKARYRQALSNLSRQETLLRAVDQDIVVQVRAAVRAVETNRESVDISAKATELSQRQYDLEKARYDAGLSTFRRVQEAQEDLDNARVSELQAKVNLRVALADLARLEGSSLERYKITLMQ